MAKAAPATSPSTVHRLYTEAEVEAIYRQAYGDGAEAVQLERRGRPFLIEDEAVIQWQRREHLNT